MRITNNFNLPQCIVDIVKSEQHEMVDKRFSVTELLNCNTEILLKRRHNQDIELDVSKCVATLFGTAVHYYIEKFDKTGMAEIKFEQEIKNGYVLVGKLDLYDKSNSTVIDWKTCSLWKVLNNSFDDWKKQGLIYAWLLTQKGELVDKVTFYGLIKDWKQGCGVEQIFEYTFKVDPQDIIDTGKFIFNKITQLSKLENTPDYDLIKCEETWNTGDIYSVYKTEDAERATRNFDNLFDAENFAKQKGGIVKVRKGIDKKCNDYCTCRDYCKYFMEK